MATTIPSWGGELWKGCRGQVKSASIESGANCDNCVVTMLICTQPTATSVKKIPFDTMHPRAPSAPSYAFLPPLPPFPVLSDPSLRWLSHATRALFLTLVLSPLWPCWHTQSTQSFLVLMSSYPRNLEPLEELPSSKLWNSNNPQLHLNLHNALSMSLWSLASVQPNIAFPLTQLPAVWLDTKLQVPHTGACSWTWLWIMLVMFLMKFISSMKVSKC